MKQKQIYTTQQISNQIDQLAIELDASVYEDTNVQLGELTRIRDEIDVLVDSLEQISQDNVIVVVLNATSDKLDSFSIYVDEILAQTKSQAKINTLGFELQLENVSWTFEPETVTAHGSWVDINTECNWFNIDDLCDFGKLSIE